MKNQNFYLIVSILLLFTACNESTIVRGNVKYHNPYEPEDLVIDDKAQIILTNDFENCEILDNYLKPAHVYTRIIAYEEMINFSKNLHNETNNRSTKKKLNKEIKELNDIADREVEVFKNHVSSWEEFNNFGDLASEALEKLKTNFNYKVNTNEKGHFEFDDVAPGKYIILIISGYTEFDNAVEKNGQIVMDKVILKSGGEFSKNYKFSKE